METKMKNRVVVFLAMLTIFGVSQAAAQEKSNKQLPMEHMKGLLQLVETIPLPGDGYFDQLTYDIKTMHLFVPGEDDHTMIEVDMKTGKVIHITNLPGAPRRAFFVPTTNEVWVDLGLGANLAVALDATTMEIVKTLELSGGKAAPGRDADNGAFDFAKGLFYISARYREGGTESGAIDIVDTKAAKLVGSIKLNGSLPEGVVLEPSGKRLYVGMGDVVNGGSICEVIDTEKRQVVDEWPVTGGPQVHIGGLDAAHHRLFMGSRLGGGHNGEPNKLVVMSTDTGKVIQVLDAPGGIDEIFYDAPTARIYVAGTVGNLAVYHQDDPDHYKYLGKVPTGPISKTGIWIPELKRYYAAVPKFMSKPMTADKGHQKIDNWIVLEGNLMVFEAIP
jgi:DNA-binding beta-propeller fold protein YncE